MSECNEMVELPIRIISEETGRSCNICVPSKYSSWEESIFVLYKKLGWEPPDFVKVYEEKQNNKA